MSHPVIVTPGEVGVITINRPEVFNALNSEVLTLIDAGRQDLTADPACRAIIVTGTGGRAFSAGADLDEITALTPDTASAFLSRGQAVFRALELSPVPVIAAVNGLALGGGFELIMACAFSVFATNASAGLPETGLGLIPGYGGTQRLTRLAGRAVGLHLMLTGERLSAERAYALGITPVPPVEPGALLDAARQLAGKIARKGPRAVASVIQATSAGDATAHDPWLALETSLAASAAAGSEAAEGIAAFREKRAALFPGRGNGCQGD